MSLFTTLKTFSIVAGIMLIFLLFVMLAAERRGELGIAPAVGTRRGHLVEMYLFEGVAYDLMAAIVGDALGVAVALGMVFVLARAFASFGFDITFHVTTQSLVLSYALGVLLTLVVVAVSALRVSVLNITAAVRNLPDPGSATRGRRRWILALVGLALGLLLAVLRRERRERDVVARGLRSSSSAVASLATKLGVHKRVAYTTAGSRDHRVLAAADRDVRLHRGLLARLLVLPRRRARDRARRDLGDRLQRRADRRRAHLDVRPFAPSRRC